MGLGILINRTFYESKSMYMIGELHLGHRHGYFDKFALEFSARSLVRFGLVNKNALR